MISFETAKENPIARFLIACIAYEKYNTPIMSDSAFDRLGEYISDNWDSLDGATTRLIQKLAND